MAAVALLLLVLAAGGGNASPAADDSAAPDTPRRGGTVAVGLAWQPTSVNVVTDGSDAYNLTNPMTDPLVDVDDEGRLFGLVSSTVPTVENGGVQIRGKRMHIAFDIRPHAHWSDGTPITCQDVRFLWQTTMNPKLWVSSRNGWDKVESVRCPTAKSVVITTKERFAQYMSLLRQVPLPAHELRGKDFSNYWADRMTVSNGPFRFVRWDRGIRLILERDPGYWNAGQEDKPFLDRLEFRFLSDVNTLNLQLGAGEIQLIERALETPLEEQQVTFAHARILLTPNTGIEHIGFQTKASPVDDLRVRRALAHAIDRVELTDRLLRKPFRTLDSTVLPQNTALFEPVFSRYRYDPQQVDRLLTSSNYVRGSEWWEKDGEPLTITFKAPSDKNFRVRVAQLIQEQLRREGIRLKILLEDGAVFEGQSLSKGLYQMGMWSLPVDTDPNHWQTFTCRRLSDTVSPYQFCSRAFERLLKSTTTELNIKRRADLERRVQRTLSDNVVLLPLYQQVNQVVHDPRLHNVRPNPRGGVGWNADTWWMSR